MSADTRGIRERAEELYKNEWGEDSYEVMWTGKSVVDFGVQFAESIVEQCCKDVCSYCADGDVPERRMYSHPPKPFWVHTMIGFDDRTEDCNAGAIHERLGISAIRARQEGS